MKDRTKIEEQIAPLLQDVIRPDETVDDDLLKKCGIAYERACFFVRNMPLHGLASTLPPILRISGVLPRGETAGTSLITSANQHEPISMEGFLRIIKSIKALRDADDFQAPGILEIQLYLRKYFPHPDVVEPGSVISSLRTVKMEIVDRVKQRVSPNSTLEQFSYEVFKDTNVYGHKKSKVLGHLKEGYLLPNRRKGILKLTKYTAEALHQGLVKISGEKDMPEFEEFAPVNPLAGDRDGQCSRALSHRNGNLISPTF